MTLSADYSQVEARMKLARVLLDNAADPLPKTSACSKRYG